MDHLRLGAEGEGLAKTAVYQPLEQGGGLEKEIRNQCRRGFLGGDVTVKCFMALRWMRFQPMISESSSSLVMGEEGTFHGDRMRLTLIVEV